MARPRAYRDSKLYVRIKVPNSQFLTEVLKRASLTKTKWIDSHLDYLREKYSVKQASEQIAKTGN